jgi:hypothetical protein
VGLHDGDLLGRSAFGGGLKKTQVLFQRTGRQL